MELLPSVFAIGWASGINAYLTVVVLGLLGRYGDVAGIPAALERTDVLVIAGIMAVVEMVVDKIPYVDTGWDVISTAIRPTVGALLGLLMAAGTSPTAQLLLAASGGFVALLSHLVKSGLRLGINTSPEPASNIAASIAEDLAVAGMTTLAVLHPWAAFSMTAALLVAGVILVIATLPTIKRGYRRWRDHRRRTFAAP